MKTATSQEQAERERNASSLARQLDSPWGQQNPHEIAWLLERIRGVRSVLEIGSCFGRSLEHFASVMVPGAIIRSIDLGHSDEWLPGIDTTIALKRVITKLKVGGFDADVIIADSKSAEAISWAKASAPYDLIFIDADHSYEGVLEDWRTYSSMGHLVAFHDIAHRDHGVRRLWSEIKAQGNRTEECIDSPMGIGIVYMDTKREL